MSMTVGNPDAEDDLVADINTTPLVDVMLVLLIIFLITYSRLIQSVAVELPRKKPADAGQSPRTSSSPSTRTATVLNNTGARKGMLLTRLRKSRYGNSAEIHIAGDKRGALRVHRKSGVRVPASGDPEDRFITEPPARTGSRQGVTRSWP